jgi:glutamate transport system substrate-binding protein
VTDADTVGRPDIADSGAVASDPDRRELVARAVRLGVLVVALVVAVAADLGFRPDEVRFLAIESEDRARMLAEGEQRVDLVIASYSITEERENQPGVTFSAPYLETEQSVVTRADYQGSVNALEDLRGKQVCTLSTLTSGTAVERMGVRDVKKALKISECIEDLLRGDAVAVITDAAILAGFVDRHPKDLQHHDIGLEDRELYGINTGDNKALRKLSTSRLYESLTDPRDDRWEEAFAKNLAPLRSASRGTPIALAQQPNVEEVKVRWWPWEMTALPAPVDRTGARTGR